MKPVRALIIRTVPFEKLMRKAARQWYCRNCGDPAPSLADEDWNGRVPSGSWRPCPNPSPGRPMIDCGVGGHMYTDSEPRID